MDKEYGVKLAYYESLLENSYAEAVAKLKESMERWRTTIFARSLMNGF